MIDSHIHLDFFAPEELDGLLEEARKGGVSGFVVPAASPKDWARVRGLVEAESDVKAAFGIHPWFAADDDDLEAVLDELRVLLAHPKTIAVGECGLDRLRESEVPFGLQEEAFRAQLELARELAFPVILHAVRCVPEVATTFSEAKLARGVIHGFVGNHETAKMALDRGLFLGIGARALEHEKTREVLRRVPLDRVLLETDAPDTRFRGSERGVPGDLSRALREFSALRSEAAEVVRGTLEENSRQFFERG